MVKTDTSGAAAPRRLPDRPSLEHLKNEAKQRLRSLRAEAPDARLADAQLAVARGYGFASWRALAEHMAGLGASGAADALIGFYRLDPAVVAENVVAISRRAGQLMAQETGRPPMPLDAEGPNAFVVRGSGWRYRFEAAREGPAEVLWITHAGEPVRAERTTSEAADAAQAAYARDLSEQARPRSPAKIPETLLDRYPGYYVSPFGLVLDVRRKGGGLLVRAAGQPEIPVTPEGPDRFYYPMLPAQLSFAPDGDEAEAVTVHQNGRRLHLRRVDPEQGQAAAAAIERKAAEQERPRTVVTVGPETLERYAGRYRLSPAQTLEVAVEDGRLFAQLTGQRRFELFAEGETRFFATIAAVQVEFISSAGRIDRLVVHQAGRETLLMRAGPAEGDGA